MIRNGTNLVVIDIRPVQNGIKLLGAHAADELFNLSIVPAIVWVDILIRFAPVLLHKDSNFLSKLLAPFAHFVDKGDVAI